MKTTLETRNCETIKTAMNPCWSALRAAALKRLRKQSDRVYDKLVENGMDFHAAYPYPKAWGMGQSEYGIAMAKYTKASTMVVTDPDSKVSYMPDAPRLVIMKPDLHAQEEKTAGEYAHTFIDAYSTKLAAKVAKTNATFQITDATYTGTTDPFAASVLTLLDRRHTPWSDQHKMVWNTKCILNISKYDNLFNQWPTRLAK